jgi:hypothetical protein
MSASLRFDVAKFRRIMAEKKKRVSAASFRPQMEKFVSRALAVAAANCPTRDLALIQAAQSKQYDNRANYIPSIHDDTADPRLIVKEDVSWLFSRGRWFRVPGQVMPDEDWANYAMLDAERNRRLETPKAAFIANRAQARFLYVQQFWLIARSLGVRAPIAGEAIASHSRRQPPKAPPRPNARWQGGKDVLAAVISAPFLSTATAYWQGNGLDILRDASAAERPAFVKAVRDEMIKRLSET